MLRLMLMLSIMSLVTGCATSTTDGQSSTAAAQGPGVEEGIMINCSGPDAGWVFCYRSASTVCGVAGYSVVRRSDQTAPAAATNETRTMQVKCN